MIKIVRAENERYCCSARLRLKHHHHTDSRLSKRLRIGM